MAIRAGTYEIGPETGALLVHTSREGAASRVGHDLTVTFDTWSGRVVIGADMSDVHVEATIDVQSFRVLKGSGGVAPLLGRDRRDITATAMRLLAAATHPQAAFTSTSATPVDDDGGTLDGTVTIRGVSTPVTLDVTSTDDRAWHIETSLLQSNVGITPHRALFGALRVADRVGISADVRLTP